MCIVESKYATLPSTSKWQYYLDRPMDGKIVGWHDYDIQASARLEAEHQERPTQTLRRTVWHLRSGFYMYEVNLQTMKQRNMTTGTVRTIRRETASKEAVPLFLFNSLAPKSETIAVTKMEPLVCKSKPFKKLSRAKAQRRSEMAKRRSLRIRLAHPPKERRSLRQFLRKWRLAGKGADRRLALPVCVI